MFQHIAVNYPDVISEKVHHLRYIKITVLYSEFRHFYIRCIIVVWRQIVLCDKLFSRNALDKNIVNVNKSRAVRSFRSGSHAYSLCDGKGIVDTFVCNGFAVMIFVRDDQIGYRSISQPSCHCLNHHDPAQLHIDTKIKKGFFYLFTQFFPMNQKQHCFSFICKTLCNGGNDNRLTAAARKNDTGRFISVGICLKQPVYQVLLVVS